MDEFTPAFHKQTTKNGAMSLSIFRIQITIRMDEFNTIVALCFSEKNLMAKNWLGSFVKLHGDKLPQGCSSSAFIPD